MRLFEILDKLNVLDTESEKTDNRTQYISVCPDVISVDKKGNNGEVKVGIPGNLAQELVLNDMKGKCILLLVIDLEKYEEIKSLTQST